MNCPNCGSKKFVPLQTGGGYCPTCKKSVPSKFPTQVQRKAQRKKEKDLKKAAEARRQERLRY